jgi:multidrug resistance efflux pump
MRGDGAKDSGHALRRYATGPRLLSLALAMFAVCASASCRSGSGANDNNNVAEGIIVVNAPASGVVKRVLVGEGVEVQQGAGVVEITVATPQQRAQAQPSQDPVARAAQNYGAAQNNIEAARAEVVRAEVEVHRLEPLVAAGQASQGELDGARAVYERAQQKLQSAQNAAQSAQSGIITARQQQLNGTNGLAPAATPAEQTIYARATSAGRVAVINVRVGERVTEGQPLATLRAGGE